MRALKSLIAHVLILLSLAPAAFAQIRQEATRERPFVAHRFEFFGNAAFQLNDDGSSFAGGLRYSPAFALGDTPFAIKPYGGMHLMKASDAEIYYLADYGLFFQVSDRDAFSLSIGGGAGTSLGLARAITRPTIGLGIDFKLPNPIFGLLDAVSLNVHRVINSDSLLLITYGIRISF